jgi:HemY protein
LPAGRLLAARPQAESALAARDLPLAMEHVRRGLTVDPQAPALLRLRHELDMRLGRWADAQESLRALARARLIDGDQLNRRAALVWLGRARAAERDQAINDAADHARRAWKTLPAFLPAAIESARLDLASGRAARASQTIESSWTSCPHPDLAAAYLDAQPGADPLTQVKRCQLLVERAPRAAESHLAQGNAARKARLWGEARRHYQTALDLDPTVARRAAIGLAQVAIAEPPMETLVAATETGGDDPEQPRAALTTRPAEAGVAPELVARVAEAPPERGWLCGACGTPHRRWEPICPTCDGIDTVEWRQPPAMPATSIEAGIPVAAMLLPPVRD